jgi:L-asparaginase II
MLARAGLDLEALECGAHWPYREPIQRQMAAAGIEPSALHNNCSGKHAGFLCLACRLAGDQDRRGYARGYIGADHPVMQAVTAALQTTTGFDLATTARGTDGCSIPTYAIPLRHLAHAFARVGSGTGLATEHAEAARRLRRAVARHPFMVGGTGRFDTRVMERLGERVFCKVGAEAGVLRRLSRTRPGRGDQDRRRQQRPRRRGGRWRRRSRPSSPSTTARRSSCAR